MSYGEFKKNLNKIEVEEKTLFPYWRWKAYNNDSIR